MQVYVLVPAEVGEAEVDQLYEIPFLGEKHILGLQISMDDI